MRKMAGKKPTRGVEGSEKVWGLEEIEQLIDALIERQVTEFELEQNGAKIRIKRGTYVASSVGAGEVYLPQPAAPPLTPLPAAPAASLSAPLPAEEPLAPETPAEAAEDLYVMKSPIVGTFYAASSPNAPPFVNVGDTVQLGQVLCIIEAMKLMNELEAEMAGEIARIYVESGQPVEYGQSLFAIKPTRGK
jgi:acetyl-CoA carboxylase biotin carboxyl carrier protein